MTTDNTNPIEVFRFRVGVNGRALVHTAKDMDEAEWMTTTTQSRGQDERGEWFLAWEQKKPEKPVTAKPAKAKAKAKKGRGP